MIKLTWEFATDRENGHTYILDPDHPMFLEHIRAMTPMCRKVLRLYLQEVLEAAGTYPDNDEIDYGL